MNDTHRTRMARKKAIIDENIRQASQERGVLIVNTGNGKGKSSAAFGVAARALGHGMKVGIVQFIKGRDSTGEEAFFRRFPEVSFHVMGEGFTWDTQSRERDEAAAARGWQQALALLSAPDIQLVVLDELNIVLKYRYLPLAQVLDALRQRPPQQHVIVTGRGAPAELLDMADTVTEMKEIKHAFKAGIRAQSGIEF